MYYYIKKTYPGNTYMAPVSIGDSRPNQGNFFEYDHVKNLEWSWKSCIGDDTRDASGALLHVKALLRSADLVRLRRERAHAAVGERLRRGEAS